MYHARNEIEEAIISAIIDDNGFSAVLTYLTTRNFMDKRFQQIFIAAQNLYPTSPINPLSLKLELDRIYKDNASGAIAFMYGRRQLAATNTVKYWCLVLLQLDIKHAYQVELLAWKDIRRQEHNLIEAAVIDEVFLNITDDVDILLLIEKSMVFFEKHKMADELSKAQAFTENVVKKTVQIKKNIALEIAMTNIFAIAQSSPEVMHYCKKFAEAIAYMSITNKIKSSYTTAANLL